MASRFDEQWSRIAEPNMQRQFGVSLTYTDGVPTSLEITNALVTREVQSRRPNHIGGWDAVTTRTARFATPDETLRLDGSVSVDGLEYSIENIASVEGQRTELALLRVEIGELTRPEYRQR